MTPHVLPGGTGGPPGPAGPAVHLDTTHVPRSTTMNLLNEHLARARCPRDARSLERAGMVRALRAQRRAERLERRASAARARAVSEWRTAQA